MDTHLSFENSIEDFNQLLIKYCNGIQEIYLDLSQKDLAYKTKQYTLMYFERYGYGWEGVKQLTLTKDFTHFNYAIPILVRTIISDIITISYMLSNIEIDENTRAPQDETQYMKIIKDLDHGFLEALLAIRKMYPHDEIILNRELQGMKATVKEKFGYDDFFEEKADGTLHFKRSNQVRIGQIYDKILHDIFKKNANILYKFYCQYEHFSPLTKELIYPNQRDCYYYFLQAFKISIVSSNQLMNFIYQDPQHPDFFRTIMKEFEAYLSKHQLDLR